MSPFEDILLINKQEYMQTFASKNVSYFLQAPLTSASFP
jgi:hypothetical protein